MWKVTRKGLYAHKLRFVLTAVAVIISVAFMSGTSVLSATLQKSFDDLFASIYKNTDAVVRSPEVLDSDFGSGQRPNVPASLADIVRSTPTVAAAEGNVNSPYAQVVDKNGDALGGNGPPTFGLGWNPNPQLNQFHIQPGGRPPKTDNEIVIDKQTADTGDLSVGDRVTVLTSKQPKKYDIVGIAKFGTADNAAGASITLFTMPEAQRIANSVDQYGEISVVAKPGVSQNEVKADIQKALDDAGMGKKYEVVTGDAVTKENQDAINKQLGGFRIVLTGFAVVALLVGAFIIYNTFSIVVAQRLREMALLRAIGASRRQVLTSVIAESLVVGIVASLLGLFVGILLALGLKAGLDAAGFGLPKHSIVISPPWMIGAFLAGTIVTLLSSIIPARQAARIPPVAAMRSVALERPINVALRSTIGIVITAFGVLLLAVGLSGKVIGAVALAGFLVLIGVFVLSPLFARGVARAIGAPLSRIKGITGSLARENAARNPRRTATTGAAVMIAVSLVGFITVFAASANASISAAIDSQLKTDYIITSSAQGGGGAPAGLSPKLGEQIAQLPEVAASTPVRLGDASINGSRTFLNAVDAVAGDKLLDLDTVAGSLSEIENNGLGISKRKADDHHWKIGTTLPVTFVKTGKVPLKVGFIYKANTFGDYFISLKTFEQNYTEQLDFLVLAKLKPGVTAEQGRAAIEPLLKAYPTAKLKDNAQYKADQKKQINGFVNFFYVMLFLAVVIAAIGITNTMTLSIHERTKELGLLRAVGESRRQTRSMIRWEAVIMALFGTLLGLAIAVFFGWAIIQALHDTGFTEFSLGTKRLAIIVILAWLFGVVAAILPARRAARLNVLDAIQHE